MKFVHTLLMFLLPAGLVAGVWTGTQNHINEAPAGLLVAHKAVTLSLSVLDALERITEPGGLLLLGTCLVLMAWLLHRLRRRTGA